MLKFGEHGHFVINKNNYKSIKDALPDLQKARLKYILEILHTEYRTLSKGQQKREEIERLKQKDYQKYLQQF